MNKILLTCLVSLGLISYANAQQVGIGTNSPDASAKLDIASGGNTGILFPRVALTATNAAGPVTSPANWLTVFNTATAGSGNTAVVPGLYYWNTATSEWIRLRTSADGGTLDAAYDYNGPGAGRIINATDGAVLVQGTDGLQVVGTMGSGATLALAGGGTRAFFYPRKSAFRAGSVANTEWNDANIGNYSVAMGQNTTASYTGSIALGFGANANGDYALAMGYQTTAGESSTAMGYQTTASGIYSTAMGIGTNATGLQSTAIGSFTNASGFSSTVMGYLATASGSQSTAIGSGTIASGEWATAMGYYNTSSGKGSTTMGVSQTAFSYGETVLGIGATSYTPSTNGATQFRAANGTDRLFVIGNAIDANNNDLIDFSERSNALTILKNGSTTLSTLAGTGTRLVTATSTGTLGTGTSTSLINAHNGLSEVGTDEVVLGGALDQATTTITQDGTESFTIANTGSGGTYINLASTGDFQVQDNGVTQFHVEDNGNVGIGITGATGTQAKFDLRSNAIIGDFNASGFYNSNAMLHIRKTDAPHLLMEDIANNTGGLALDGNGIYMATESTRNLYFKTGVTSTGSFISTGTTQLFINGSNGRVGIGTTTPAYTLTVPSTFTFGYGNGTATYSSRTETRDNAGLQGNAGAQSGFFETSVPAPAANWYPGANSWQHLIDVHHSNDANNYAMQLAGGFFDQNLWFRKTNNNAAGAWSRILTTLDNGNFIQNQNAAAQATSNYWISGTGTANLMNSVSGYQYNGVPVIYNNPNDVYANIRVLQSNSTANDGMYINYNSTGTTGADLRFYANGTNERLRIKANTGFVGINTTTPGYLLTLAGTGNIFAVDNTASFNARNATAGYETYLWPRWSDNVMYQNYGTGGFNIRNNGSATTMFMDNSNNVGIPTTTGYKLTIGGDTYVNGGWLRIAGGQGVYWETYGGGWYMQDVTWLRAYNNKPILATGGLAGYGNTPFGTPFGISPRIYANYDNVGSGGILVSDDGGFADYNDGFIQSRISNGIEFRSNSTTINGRWTMGDINGSGVSDKLVGTATNAWGIVGQSGLAWWQMWASSFNNASQRELKKDITPITGAVSDLVMADLDKMNPYMYRYKVETDDWQTDNTKSKYRTTTHLGLITDETPDYVLSQSYDGVDIYAAATLGIAAAKHNREEIKAIQKAVGLADGTYKTEQDFGTIITADDIILVRFATDFKGQIPVVTLSSNQPNVQLAVSEKTSQGFKIKVSHNTNHETIQIDYIAMAKVQTVLDTKNPEQAVSPEVLARMRTTPEEKQKVHDYWQKRIDDQTANEEEHRQAAVKVQQDRKAEIEGNPAAFQRPENGPVVMPKVELSPNAPH